MVTPAGSIGIGPGDQRTEEVSFDSEGATLRGMLLRPERGLPPIVIMAHGTSATIRMVADEYAYVFRRSGLAVLLYDHRNFGRSDGEPRQETNPWIQARGFLAAIDFVQTLGGIDHDRVGLWGGTATPPLRCWSLAPSTSGCQRSWRRSLSVDRRLRPSIRVGRTLG